MPNSVFICGPQACGKTTNAKAFAESLGISEIVDDWTMGDNFKEEGVLYLTNESDGEIQDAVLSEGSDITVLTYDKAKRLYL